jgi:hypothetical protein
VVNEDHGSEGVWWRRAESWGPAHHFSFFLCTEHPGVCGMSLAQGLSSPSSPWSRCTMTVASVNTFKNYS